MTLKKYSLIVIVIVAIMIHSFSIRQVSGWKYYYSELKKFSLPNNKNISA